MWSWVPEVALIPPAQREVVDRDGRRMRLEALLGDEDTITMTQWVVAVAFKIERLAFAPWTRPRQRWLQLSCRLLAARATYLQGAWFPYGVMPPPTIALIRRRCGWL